MQAYTTRTARGQPLRTRMICTLGPSSRDPSVLAELIEAGMSVARLNMSHGDHALHRETFRAVREVSSRMRREIAVMMDLSGPKIRLLEIEGGAFELKTGEHIAFVRVGIQLIEPRSPLRYYLQPITC